MLAIDAILFDLFGTLVSIDVSLLPRTRAGVRERVVTIPEVDLLLARLAPKVAPAVFFAKLEEVSAAMAEEKARRDHVELPSRERFRRTLEQLRLAGAVGAVAEEMSERHMASLAAAVVCPPGRSELLAALARDYRVGLVSNFDHGPTAHAVLGRNGLSALLDPVVISDDVGVRKPGARIFEISCGRIGVAPSRCLYVGDSYDVDVCGASEAGLQAVWIDGADRPHRPALGKIGDVAELPAWLGAARFN